ncbi:hypothetical protein MSAN_01806000 [Mycena sanguinolenta]|uniref:Nephrocystin 3-like N-terminal domain-containing protein n=1 Tax=Mycena sanguinolenta TaxID=230812 RepID=A0A8H6XT16_9AGAR|nr:hypothetical protein MSAN_01806000 [Mycena sanguinolenta]
MLPRLKRLSKRVVQPPSATALAHGGNPSRLPGPTTHNPSQRSMSHIISQGALEILRIVKEAGSIFPPLQTTAGAILSIAELVLQHNLNIEEAHSLRASLDSVADVLERTGSPNAQLSKEARERFERLSVFLERQKQTIEHFLDRKQLSRNATATHDSRDLAAAMTDLSSVLTNFLVETALSTEIQTARVLTLSIKQQLYTILTPVLSAAYEFDGPVPRRTCTPNTRVNVLETIHEWVVDKNEKNIFCLIGMAGTGKTTIAQTICSILHKAGNLGASFFCSRSSIQTRDGKLIAPTIAYQLALCSAEIGQHLLGILQEPGAVRSFQNLVLNPLMAAGFPSNKTIVIVIDALNEAELNVAKLFHDIHELTSRCPFILKVFLTFRPEIPFHGFQSELDPAWLLLHDVEKDLVEKDIRIFVDERLQDIAVQRRTRGITVDASWPPAHHVDALVKRSSNLFIYAATACEYIDGDGRGSILDRLRWITDSTREPSRQQVSVIDNLYSAILHSAFWNLEPEEAETVRRILQTILVAARPLTARAIASLIHLADETTVYQHLVALHSVLRVPMSGEPITIFHASFPDFLTTESRAGNYFLAIPEANLCLLQCSFEAMDMLHENICDIDIISKGRLVNSQIDLNVILTKVSDVLVYSSENFIGHCCNSKSFLDIKDDIRSRLRKFFLVHVLAWIEVLSLKGLLHVGLAGMQKLEKWVPLAETELRSLVRDVRRLIALNFDFLQTHGLEVYHSAIVWLPLSSHIRRRHFNENHHPRVTQGLSLAWDACEMVLSSRKLITSVAFSPDGIHMISGSWDKSVCIWNAETGVNELELTGHTDFVSSVAFSLDSSQIVSGSLDCSVCIWNATTGRAQLRLVGHFKRVMSVGFSPDGTRVVSGSDDLSIRIWDAKTGSMELNLQGHSDIVTSVAFSPDGTRVVSGSRDKSVRIWNVETGTTQYILTGHLGRVYAVSFSPDATRVVSASGDQSIWLWHADSGAILLRIIGHSARVTSVAFSRDGARLVSGSQDHTVRLWNAETGAAQLVLTGHTAWVTSVAFAPDGTRVISGSDDASLRVWNVETATAKTEPEHMRHSARVTSLAFSSDGTQLISGSKDQSVQVWNVETGRQLFRFTGHPEEIVSVAFSADNIHVISCSRDKCEKQWDMNTGLTVLESVGNPDWVNLVMFLPDGTRVLSVSENNYEQSIRVWNIVEDKVVLNFKSSSERVWSIAVSPDGSRGASGFQNGSVCIWNIESDAIELQLSGHSSGVNSVAFSCDGTRLASGSDDLSVRVWNAQTGSMEIMFEGHSAAVMSVAFSVDGTRVVSGSKDNSARVWNIEMEAAELILTAHSDAVNAVAFSPSGTHVVSGSDDRSIRIWNAKTGAVALELTGHLNAVTSVAFSSDGSKLVSGSRDESVLLWNARSGEPCGGHGGHAATIRSAAFSPDGTRVVSGSNDGAVRLWNAETGGAQSGVTSASAVLMSIARSADGRALRQQRHQRLFLYAHHHACASYPAHKYFDDEYLKDRHDNPAPDTTRLRTSPAPPRLLHSYPTASTKYEDYSEEGGGTGYDCRLGDAAWRLELRVLKRGSTEGERRVQVKERVVRVEGLGAPTNRRPALHPCLEAYRRPLRRRFLCLLSPDLRFYPRLHSFSTDAAATAVPQTHHAPRAPPLTYALDAAESVTSANAAGPGLGWEDDEPGRVPPRPDMRTPGRGGGGTGCTGFGQREEAGCEAEGRLLSNAHHEGEHECGGGSGRVSRAPERRRAVASGSAHN